MYVNGPRTVVLHSGLLVLFVLHSCPPFFRQIRALLHQACSPDTSAESRERLVSSKDTDDDGD